ncbi:MAG: hypothetical protein HFG37_10525 [Eubacterium sp.]|nr:hypothetical protein [Eubacterium sp.]
MNINFHYYLVKAMSIEAGLSEDEAQIVALTSQMVDDVTPNFFKGEKVPTQKGKMLKIYVENQPPKYFRENAMVGEAGHYYYEFLPSITSFGLSDARKEFYQLESVMPFHFFVENYTENPADRSILRTKPALRGSYLHNAIDAIVDSMVQDQEAGDDSKRLGDLVQFGMLLHVFADTFAHDGFSGSLGWENEAKIINIYEAGLQERGREGIEHFSDRLGSLTACGHGQLAHLPDVCSATFWYRYKAQENDDFSKEKCRCNRIVFEQCAKYIFEWLMKLSRAQDQTASRWNQIRESLMETACLVTSEMDDVTHAKELAAVWAANYFHDQDKMSQLEYSTQSLFGQAVAGNVKGVPIYRFENEIIFYLYNQATYELRRIVTGKY